MAAGSVLIEQKRKRFSCSLPGSDAHILEDPVQFLCRHHYCRGCLESDQFEKQYGKLENVADQQQGNNNNNIVKITCPVCKTESGNEDIVEDPAIKQIVAVFKKEISGDQKCDICNTKMSDVRCYDCNQDLCKDCNFHHSMSSASKMHEPKSLQEVEQRIIVSSTHYCQPHKKTKELYCMVCEVVKCYLCDLLKSCGHKEGQKVMTIPEAVELLKKSGDETIQLVASDIVFLKERLENLDKLQRESEMEENNKVNDIDEKTNTLINRLKNDGEKVKTEIKGFYSEKKQEIEADRCITRATLEKVLALMEYLNTILDHMEGADLLLQLQSKFRKLLNEYRPYDRSIEPVMKVLKQIQHKEYIDNMVAIVKNEGENIPQMHQKLQMVETELAASGQKSRQLEAENIEKQKKIQELEKAAMKMQEQNQTQANELKTTNDKHNAAQAKIKELENNNKSNTDENKKLQDEIKAAVNKQNNTEAKLKEIEEAKKKTTADNEAAKKKLQEEVAAKQTKIKELEQQTQAKVNETKAANDKCAAAEKKVKEIEESNKKSTADNEAAKKKLQEEVAAKQNKIKELEQQTKAKANETKAANDKCAAAEKKVKEIEEANKKNVAAKDAKIKQLEADIAKLKQPPAKK